MPTAAASRKRKQTEDMEISPPKRVTRARAAGKVQEADSSVITKTAPSSTRATKSSSAKLEAKTSTKAATKPTRLATTTKQSAKPAAAAAEDQDEEGENEENVDELQRAAASVAEVPKTRGRPRKVAGNKKEVPKAAGAAKPRGRPPKAASTRTTNARAAKAKTTAAAVSDTEDVESDEDDELMAIDATKEQMPGAASKKTTRGRPVATSKSTVKTIKVTAPSSRAVAVGSKAVSASRATAATAATTSRAANTAGSRRVAFADDLRDKENRPVSRGGEARDAKDLQDALASSMGVRGKPVRRAKTGSVSDKNSSHPSSASTTKQPSDEERPKTPLSPKKVDQVAKGNGTSPAVVDHDSSSEDELSGHVARRRSPAVRPLQKSPIKPPASARKETMFAAPNMPGPVRMIQQSATTPGSSDSDGNIRPGSKGETLPVVDGENLLSRSPVRPPPSASKPMPPARPGSSGRPLTSGGDQPATTLNVPLLSSPAKRPPPTPIREGGIFNESGEPRSILKEGSSSALQSEQQDMVAASGKKRNLLQSPARRPKIAGALTSVPKEKRVAFPFGDKDAQSFQSRAFRFSAATPKRIRIIKPSQRLLDDVVEENDDKQDDVEAPASTGSVRTADTDGDVSMLDVQDDTVIYTPSKRSRVSLFDTPLVRRSRSSSPQKTVSFTPMNHETTPDLPSAATTAAAMSVASTGKTNRTLFRENLAVHSDDELSDLSVSFSTSVSVVTPNVVHDRGVRSSRRVSRLQARESQGVTTLANQFSQWLAASPEKPNEQSSPETMSQPTSTRGIASPTKSNSPDVTSARTVGDQLDSPTKSIYFDDEMATRTLADVTETEIDLDLDVTNGDVVVHNLDIDLDAEDQHDASLEDGENTEPNLAPVAEGVDIADENAFPMDPAIRPIASPVAGLEPTLMNLEMSTSRQLRSSTRLTVTVDPLTLSMTPAQAIRPPPQEILTVSKVPLKPADSALNASPVKAFRKKAKSMALGAPLGEVDLASLAQPALEEAQGPQTPVKGAIDGSAETPLTVLATPFRTPRVGADAMILRGAVVYVDVHTTEGADASSLFVELLTQMGARCVKQWTWNPRSNEIGAETPGGSKVGITHVVFKDGGKRTLEKVREAHGLVNCVGVGWVLDCERHNQWIDEAGYAVDTSIVPRGGHNRRKSMEPTALANINGILKPAQTPNGSLGRRSVSTPVANISPTKEFLTFDSTPGRGFDAEEVDDYTATPTISGPTFAAPTPTINFGAFGEAGMQLPETPAALRGAPWDFETPIATDDLGDQGAEPSTPYFMTEGAKLVQATCPPKQQTGRTLFPVSGRIDDEPNEDVRRRLEVARRKSLQWAPRIGSPLRKGY